MPFLDLEEFIYLSIPIESLARGPFYWVLGKELFHIPLAMTMHCTSNYFNEQKAKFEPNN